jgi:hypothetical protein
VPQQRPGDVDQSQPVEPAPTPGPDVSNPAIDRLLAGDEVPGSGNWAGPGTAPPTEADPVDREGVWVSLDLVVPMAAVRDLADQAS